MASKIITMDQLKLINRLVIRGYSIKGIVRQTGLARNTLKKYLTRLTDVDPPDNSRGLATAFDCDTTPLKGEQIYKIDRTFWIC